MFAAAAAAAAVATCCALRLRPAAATAAFHFLPPVACHTVEPGILPYTSFACSLQRWCGGEGQWKTHFVNESRDAAIIGITPNRPGKV